MVLSAAQGHLFPQLQYHRPIQLTLLQYIVIIILISLKLQKLHILSVVIRIVRCSALIASSRTFSRAVNSAALLVASSTLVAQTVACRGVYFRKAHDPRLLQPLREDRDGSEAAVAWIRADPSIKYDASISNKMTKPHKNDKNKMIIPNKIKTHKNF